MNALQMNVSAANIANANTPGYAAGSLDQFDSSSGAVSAVVKRTPSPDPQFSGTDLNKEIGGEMQSAQSGYSANLKVIQTQDDMLGSLMDIVG